MVLPPCTTINPKNAKTSAFTHIVAYSDRKWYPFFEKICTIFSSAGDFSGQWDGRIKKTALA
jgi:hypothetical protein